MQVYKFRTTANDDKDLPPVDIVRFVVAEHYGEAIGLLAINWNEMAFKRKDKPTHELIGEITQETRGVFNECEMIN